MRLWWWAFADLLAPRRGCGVLGGCCPVAPSGTRWSLWLWTNGRSGLCCGSHGGAIPVGRLCRHCEWPVRATCLGGPWAVGDR